MMICNLPVELQNKIFYYVAEHPCAKMIKQYHNPDFIEIKELLDKGILCASALKTRAGSRTSKSLYCGGCGKRGKHYRYRTAPSCGAEILLCLSCSMCVRFEFVYNI